MLKKISLLVVALLMISVSQALAAGFNDMPKDYAIYTGSEQDFVATFNRSAHMAKIARIRNAAPEAEIDGDAIYYLAFEGVSTKEGALLQQGITIRELKSGGLSRISFVVCEQSLAEKMYKCMLPILNLPDMPFEEIRNNIVQNPFGKDVSITVTAFEDQDNSTFYMIQFLCNN